jgi:DNA-binding transcriptional MerR regulator
MSPRKGNTTRPRTIRRLAEEAGVNIETIRFYERRGLLRKPEPPVSGWRVYDPSAVWKVHYIQLGQQLGFTLSELKKLLANVGSRTPFCTSVQRAYQDKIQLLGQKIDQMRAMRRDLKKALAACIRRMAKGNCLIAQRCGGHFIAPVSEKAIGR